MITQNYYTPPKTKTKALIYGIIEPNRKTSSFQVSKCVCLISVMIFQNIIKISFIITLPIYILINPTNFLKPKDKVNYFFTKLLFSPCLYIYKTHVNSSSFTVFSGHLQPRPPAPDIIMDDSWRMRMGMAPSLPRRRSVEDTSSRRSLFGHAGTLDADDFADVFGGPPRSVLQRKFSGDFSNSNGFYEEIFRKPDFVTPATRGGRSLPAFRIPARSDGFYSDIFGSDDDRRRSRDRSQPTSKAKSNSSSALSSEELSPLRPAIGDDVALSSFASKLRYRTITSSMLLLSHVNLTFMSFLISIFYLFLHNREGIEGNSGIMVRCRLIPLIAGVKAGMGHYDVFVLAPTQMPKNDFRVIS
jgi:hypothetical protein